jgi:transcriptional regulator with XRE-family HTH domain
MSPPFSSQLRRAVRDCGTSRYVLAKQLGIAESTLSRFLSGKRGLTLGVVDKIADARKKLWSFISIGMESDVRRTDVVSDHGDYKKESLLIRRMLFEDAVEYLKKQGRLETRTKGKAEEYRIVRNDECPSTNGVDTVDDEGVANSPWPRPDK